ncbi:methyltransferase [Actinomadura craniellae]|uniref:methyltransferase n=1 Tax=Actinomadura craniellae TaxID=2231787 RepID=UPI0013141CE5|nr:methyltransferase [Actinomadura craniellae]
MFQPDLAQPQDPEQRLRAMVSGYRLSQVVYAATKLGVADALGAGPRPVGAVARECGADPGVLARVLRVLAAAGLVSREADSETYALTGTGALLRSDVPGSLASWVVTVSEEQYVAWSQILHTVRTGRPAFDVVYGESFWDNLAANPAAAREYAAGMSASVRETCEFLLSRRDFREVSTIADVGGGAGAVVTELLRAHPHLTAILQDLPDAAAAARTGLAAAGMADRCSIVTGSFLESVPPGADVYLLCRVLADWNDADAQAILANCRRAMNPRARLIVAGGLASDADPAGRNMLDLHLLVLTGGRERTAGETAALLEAAGFAVSEVAHAGHGRVSLVEAVPA